MLLPLAVIVAGFARFIRLAENYLTQPFVRVNLCGQRSCVGYFKSYKTLPLGLKWSDVHDDSATCVSGLADANGQDVPGNLEILDRARERKRVGWNDATFGTDGHERPLIEVLGIDHGTVHVGEDFELVRDPQVVAVGRQPIRDHRLADLLFGKGADHVVFLRHLADPPVALKHASPSTTA